MASFEKKFANLLELSGRNIEDCYLDDFSELDNVNFSDLITYVDSTEFQETEKMNLSTFFTNPTSKPYLSIEEQPQDQFRFRYESEKGSHGSLKPIVKLNNYANPRDVYIKASLYTDEENPTPHVFELGGKQCKHGICWVKLSTDFTAKFASLSIIQKKKDEILNNFKERKISNLRKLGKEINEQQIENEVQQEYKKLNLNSCRICFEAFYKKEEILCEKTFSITIFNQKSVQAGDLKITRLSSCTGKASGGDEVILLCEKIRKEDIEIHFFEKDNNDEVIWEEKGEFNPSDVHHQVAIPFKTPRYRKNTGEVFIKLYRKSDGKSSEPRKFHYRTDDEYDQKLSKRKRQNPLDESFQSSPGTSSEPIDTDSYHPELWTSGEVPSSEIENFTNEWNRDLSELFNFEKVTADAVISMTNLSLSETELKEKDVLKKKAIKNCASNDELEQLRTGITSILKNRGKEFLMKFLPVLMKIKDENHNSLLHLAILEKSDNLILVVKLLEASSNDFVNQANKLKMTPLQLAVKKGLWKIVRILLMFGADPNIKNKEGNNSIHLAAKQNLPICLSEILSPIISKKKTNFILNINALNYDGFAPLHLSIMNESKECTELLIRADADINISDGKGGKTPLHLAYEQKSSLVEYLLSQQRINQTAEDFKGCVPDFNKSTPYIQLLVPNEKTTECCIEISADSSNSIENSWEKVEETTQPIDEETENKLCEILDSSGLWKKLGLYVMDEKELDVIGELDVTPTRIVLNELKKRHNENYSKELKYILTDDKLKQVADQLHIK